MLLFAFFALLLWASWRRTFFGEHRLARFYRLAEVFLCKCFILFCCTLGDGAARIPEAFKRQVHKMLLSRMIVYE